MDYDAGFAQVFRQASVIAADLVDFGVRRILLGLGTTFSPDVSPTQQHLPKVLRGSLRFQTCKLGVGLCPKSIAF